MWVYDASVIQNSPVDNGNIRIFFMVALPRKGQIKRLTRQKRSSSAPAVLRTPTKRSSKRKVWTDDQMRAAIDAVKSGSRINCAAPDHGVPPSILKDKISRRVVYSTKPGPSSYLSDKEEKDLGGCAAVGYGKTRRDVMNTAQRVYSRRLGPVTGSDN